MTTKHYSTALTIKQPWAASILNFGKRIENRTWKPPAHIIGKKIWLHSAKKDDGWEWSQVIQQIGHKKWFQVWRDFRDCSDVGNSHNYFESLPRGAIVGSATVLGWIDSEVGQGEPWFCGPYGWVLDNVEKLDKPIPCRGQLGLWKVGAELEGMG